MVQFDEYKQFLNPAMIAETGTLANQKARALRQGFRFLRTYGDYKNQGLSVAATTHAALLLVVVALFQVIIIDALFLVRVGEAHLTKAVAKGYTERAEWYLVDAGLCKSGAADATVEMLVVGKWLHHINPHRHFLLHKLFPHAHAIQSKCRVGTLYRAACRTAKTEHFSEIVIWQGERAPQKAVIHQVCTVLRFIGDKNTCRIRLITIRIDIARDSEYLKRRNAAK